MQFSLPDLFCRHVASSFDKQLHLSELVGEEDWHFNMASGLLSFGQHLHFHAQVLGTESDHDHTWLWAWANEGSNVPPSLLQAALQMKALGEEQQITELTTPTFLLDSIDGHFLAMIASGVCGANAYYRGPYEGGAVFLLIQDGHFPRNDVPALHRIASVFPQAISSLEIGDHKHALAGYLEHYGLAGEAEGDTLVVKEDGQAVLTATFDDLNRLTNLEVRLVPALPSA